MQIFYLENPKRFLYRGNRSNLKLDVEDFANIKINYEFRKNNFPVYIDLDFIEKHKEDIVKLYLKMVRYIGI